VQLFPLSETPAPAFSSRSSTRTPDVFSGLDAFPPKDKVNPDEVQQLVPSDTMLDSTMIYRSLEEMRLTDHVYYCSHGHRSLFQLWGGAGGGGGARGVEVGSRSSLPNSTITHPLLARFALSTPVMSW
jgi:hypothetical protein